MRLGSYNAPDGRARACGRAGADVLAGLSRTDEARPADLLPIVVAAVAAVS